ncbi:MAG: PAS domain-containing sensor histidine kinase [Ignavibacterium sp.]|jgi:PAS domain S-box-containing protein|nr:PAS domain-containing sensor histidine kinase [Ignavibacterium sp.]
MLDYKEVTALDNTAIQQDIIPINVLAESKPIIVINRTNAIVFSNQAAQISFGLNNISNISQLQADINFAKILSDFFASSYANININVNIQNLSESASGQYNAEIERIEIDNTQYLLIVFHHTEKEIILEDRINSIHAAIEFASIPLMTIDSKGKISFLSHSMEEILGFGIEELYEKFFCTPLESFLSKADLLTAERAFFLKQNWVKIISLKDKGKLRFKELRLTPFLTPNADSNAFMLIAHDITDYIQKNLIAKESENKLKSIINNIRDPLFIIKRKNDKFYFENGNNSFFRVFNLEKSGIINTDIKTIFTEGILRNILKNSEMIINESLPSFEFKEKFNLIHYSCKITLMDISNEDESYVMISFNNITDQQNYQTKMKTAYEKEVQLNMLKTSFIENMSHEIRTPFNAISGYADILEESIKAGDYQNVSELLSLVKDVMSRVAHLFDHIIDMSEIESGEVTFDYVYLNCNQVLKSVDSKLKNTARLKNIELLTELSEEEVIIKTDWVKLEKIIYAVAENAIKYTMIGKVVLRSFIFNNFAYITVTDTGEGMNQEDIKYLLEPFSHEEDAYSKRCQGAGLGLAIASKLTKMMGGLFEIVSRKQTGTKITLIFPLVKIGY